MKRVIKIFSLFALLLVIVAFSPLIEACEPSLPIQIENRTDMTLTIYVQEHEAGSVGPNSTIKIKNVPGTLSLCLIEVKNSQGEIIYSRNFSTSELHDAGWKVVIPAP